MAKRTSLRPANWTWADNVSPDIGVQVEDTIWVSGMVAFDPVGQIVGLGAMRAQADQPSANIAEVLALPGPTPDPAVSMLNRPRAAASVKPYSTGSSSRIRRCV